ncbi:MAG: prolyl oligopeptidase family serine peptidase [Beijerinckiaceae bacterium]
MPRAASIQAETMAIIERTSYFAKTGLKSEVLSTRRAACAVRLRIGLRAGSIVVGGGESGEPDVAWQCQFSDRAAREADMAARAASPEFEAVRKRMSALIGKFERHVFETADLGLPSGMRDTPLDGHAMTPREFDFASAGFALKGYLHLPPGAGPFPLLITNHGSGIDKGVEDVSRPGTAALLASWGVASLLPHRRGYGNSCGPGWREEVTAPYGSDAYDAELARRLDAESADIIAALDVASALPEVDSRHVGVMGSSFGGTTTLLAAAKTDRFTCAVDFAGAAMNWDRTPGLRRLMLAAAARVSCPIFFIQAANDYSIRPTLEIPSSLPADGRAVYSRIFPTFGVNNHEGHLLESRGSAIWADTVRDFLERHL